MPLASLPAVFMRGGTSKAVMFKREDLPTDESVWPEIFASVMGSPDPYGRQLDGMGGGISSLSKVCVIGPSSRPDADVDYLFAQVSVDKPAIDLAGNCGNMSSAVGPFALEEGLVPRAADGETAVRIFNNNTGKIIVARFLVADGLAVTEGDCALEGVSGTAAPIRLEFLDPGGSKTGRLLPTGRQTDSLTTADGTRVEASLVDAGNPCVFIAAEALGLPGLALPEAMESDRALMKRLEDLRVEASVAMGVAPDGETARGLGSVPKIALVGPARDAETLGGRPLAATDHDIAIRMLSMERPHRAVPVTGALCLAVALRLPDSVPGRLAPGAAVRDGALRIAHPSGITAVDAAVEQDADGPRALHAALYRTARRLFDGKVYYHAR